MNLVFLLSAKYLWKLPNFLGLQWWRPMDFNIVTEATWKLCHDGKVKEYCFLLFGLRVYTKWSNKWENLIIFLINKYLLKNCFLLSKISKMPRKIEHGDKRISLFVHLYLWRNISKVRKKKDSSSLSNFLCQ